MKLKATSLLIFSKHPMKLLEIVRLSHAYSPRSCILIIIVVVGDIVAVSRLSLYVLLNVICDFLSSDSL